MKNQECMEGQCLCGKVAVKANRQDSVEACHCGMCRQWSGGPYLAVHCGSDVQFVGFDNVTVYSSSDWAERGFCKACGTHLFYKLKGADDYAIPAGLFQSGAEFSLASQIFIDRKPGYYSFANTTPEMTEEEVFARYAP
ncbi:GFA family protein [Marinobacter sp. 1Y8]